MYGTLDAPATRSFVAEHEGRLAGVLLVAIAADECSILDLVVDVSARRRGLARALLLAAVTDWNACGVTKAFLEVRAGNDAARALYESMGWRTVGIRLGYYADGADAAHLIWESS